MSVVRVLLTCLGGRFSLTFIRALRERGNLRLKIIGADINEDIAAKYFVDSFYKIKRGSDKNYSREILKICRKEKINILIPCADEEVLAVAKEKEIFTREGIICSVDDFQTVKLVTDKWRLFKYLKANNITVPRFKLVRKIADFKKIADFFGYPKFRFVIKPRRTRGARGVWIIGEDSQSIPLNKLQNELKSEGINKLDHLAMEYLPGPAYDVDVVAKNGTPLCIVPRRRVWKNKLSASSEGCAIEENSRIIELVSEIAGLLKINYVYDFDCGTFADGTPAVFEINPRFSGAATASLGAGVNIPLMLVKMLKGMKLARPNINFGVSMFPVAEMAFFNKEKRYAD